MRAVRFWFCHIFIRPYKCLLIWNSQCNSSKMVSGVSKTTSWERSKTQSTLKRIDYLSKIHFSIPHPDFFFFLSWAVEVSWGGKTPAMTIQQNVGEPWVEMTYPLWHFLSLQWPCALLLFCFIPVHFEYISSSLLWLSEGSRQTALWLQGSCRSLPDKIIA